MICIIENCNSLARTRGMCSKHYQRWWKHGDASFVPPRSSRCAPLDRLLANSIRLPPKSGQTIGCLEWRGSGDNTYGLMQINKKIIGVHRVTYSKMIGEISEGMLVCHTCDLPRCIEPTHLFIGTHHDNTQDMMKKGRSGRAKLTTKNILEIRRSTETVKLLAKKHNVTEICIRDVKRRITWQHV